MIFSRLMTGVGKGPEPEIETILKLVLDRAARGLGIIRGMITILNRNKGEIAIAEAWGLDGSQKNRGRYSLAACCTCRFLRHFVPQKPR
jgi:hypothetical protein